MAFSRTTFFMASTIITGLTSSVQASALASPLIEWQTERAMAAGNISGTPCKLNEAISFSVQGNTLNLKTNSVGFIASWGEAERVNCRLLVPVELPDGYYVDSVTHEINYWLAKSPGANAKIVSDVKINGFTPSLVTFDAGTSPVYGNSFSRKIQSGPLDSSSCDRSSSNSLISANLVLSAITESNEFVSVWLRSDSGQKLTFNLKSCPN